MLHAETELQKENIRSGALHKQLDSIEQIFGVKVLPPETIISKPTAKPPATTIKPTPKNAIIEQIDKRQPISEPPVVTPPKIEKSICRYEFNGSMQLEKGSIIDQVKFTLQSLSSDMVPKVVEASINMSEYTEGKIQKINFTLVESKINSIGDFQFLYREIPSADLNEFEKMNPRLLSIIITGALYSKKLEALITWNQVSSRSMTSKIILSLRECE